MLPQGIEIDVGGQTTNIDCALVTIYVDGIGVGGNGCGLHTVVLS